MSEEKSPKSAPADGGGKGRPKLDRQAQMKIGEGLRALYDDIVNQGVPDRFADLISQLEARETGPATGKKGSGDDGAG